MNMTKDEVGVDPANHLAIHMYIYSTLGCAAFVAVAAVVVCQEIWPDYMKCRITLEIIFNI